MVYTVLYKLFYEEDKMDFFDGLMRFLPFVAIVVVLIIVAVIGKRSGNSALILEEFNLNENEDEFLKIRGRASGFWNWILSLFGKAPMTSFTCSKQELKYQLPNMNYNIPIVNISCISSAMMMNSSVLLLVLGIIFIIYGLLFGGSPTLLLGMVIVGIIFIILYVLKGRTIHFGIYIGENKPMVSITMKRGIIGSIDKAKFESAADALNKAVLAKCS
jgi:hypothetical protein